MGSRDGDEDDAKDAIRVHITGNTSGQVAVGRNIQQTQPATPGAATSPTGPEPLPRRAGSSGDVFISHAAEDKAFAHAVVNRLEGEGIGCWIAPRDIAPSEKYAQAIMEGISASRVFLLIVSRSANQSSHVERELERAASRQLPIIPLRIEPVEPSDSLGYYISPLQWLDATTPPLESQLDAVVDAVGHALRRSPP